jgi:hypothetical protein
MTAQTVVDMSKLKRVFEVDKRKKTVTIDGGMTYAELVTRLSGTGLTLANTHVREMHWVALTRVGWHWPLAVVGHGMPPQLDAFNAGFTFAGHW